MSTTTRPATVRLLAAVASLLLVSALIVRTSDAAFTATTQNTGNQFTAAAIGLSDDDGGDAMFHVDGTGLTFAGALAPGATVEACIVLTYTGDVDASGVDLAYSAGAAALLSSLSVDVERFDASNCDGTVAGTVASGHSLDLAIDAPTGWAPAASTSGTDQAFRFRVTLDENAADSLQGASADGVAFTWTASS